MYESHITIENMTDDVFIDVCTDLGVKAVIIEDDTGSGLRQLMTAKFHKTSELSVAKSQMFLISTRFGNKVIRRKLEKIIGRQKQLPDYRYLEFHLKYEIDVNLINEFVELVQKSGGQTSKNVLKQTSELTTQFLFATTRDYANYKYLLKRLQHFKLVNSIMECVVYDDNPEIDSNWHGCESCVLKAVPIGILHDC